MEGEPMRILVSVAHPAHVHFFRNAVNIWREHGHDTLVVARDKDLTLDLLDEYGYDYRCLSRARVGIAGLGFELVEHESKLLRIARRLRPDVMLSIGGTFVVHVSKLLGIPSVLFTDTEHAKLSNAISFPFATKICTPACYKGDVGDKQIRYDGYQELAYLHPNRFTPDPRVLDEAGLREGEKYFVLRFVSWSAAHDIGQHGLDQEGKLCLVKELARFGRVIITSEVELPPDFEPYRIRVSPARGHDLLAKSSLYVGEGGTMASEAVLLGVPSIFVNTLRMGYVEEQQDRYGMMFITANGNAAVDRAIEWAREPSINQTWAAKRRRLLSEKIDVTAWMVEFIERCNQIH
jgi:predicted glycosyltransferase